MRKDKPSSGAKPDASNDAEKLAKMLSRKPSNNHRRGGNRDDVSKKRNDIRHYVPDATMAKDIAALPFGQLEGATFTFRGGKAAVTSTPPALGLIRFHSMVDSQYDATNGATQSARTFYTWVRHQNSGHTNYDAPDLGMYLFATNECVKIATYCKRLHKLFNTYRTDSRVVPVQVLHALGFSDATITSMLNELPSFRARVNLFIRRLSQFAFPSDVPLYSVQKFLLDGAFIDTHSVRRQYYWFEPYSWLRFDATTWPTGSALSRKSFDIGTYTSLITLMDDFDLYLDALLANEDVNIMSGDILKAYRNNNREGELFAFEELDENDTLEFKDDPNVLLRIHNATITGSELSFGDIVQSPDGVIHAIIGGKTAGSSGVVIDTSTGVQTSPALDVFKESITNNYVTQWAAASLVSFATSILSELIYDDDVIPSSDDLIERTRFMVIASGVSKTTALGSQNDAYYYTMLTHGTEIIHSISWFDQDGSTQYMGSNMYSANATFAVISKTFKHFPVCYTMTANALPDFPTVTKHFIMWYDCFTTIGFNQLDLINKVVLFQELGVTSAQRIMVK